MDERLCEQRMQSLSDRLDKLDADIAEKDEAVSRRLNGHSTRIKTLEARSIEHSKDNEQMIVLLDRLEKMVEKLSEMVEALKEKPMAKWEKIESAIISSLIGGLLGFILATMLG